MNARKRQTANIRIPSDIEPYPEKYEIEAAGILARYLGSDLDFLPRNNHKTADFMVDGVRWELKSPTGIGKHNIQHTLRAALLQSENIVFDARRSRMNQAKIRRDLQAKFAKIRKLKRLILITKASTAIEFQR